MTYMYWYTHKMILTHNIVSKSIFTVLYLEGVIFLWRGYFLIGGDVYFFWRVSFFVCFNRSRIVAVFRRRGHIVQMYPLLLKIKYNYYTTGKHLNRSRIILSL